MIKLFELFAGYGGATFALKDLGIDFDCVGFSEIDKYAIQCYGQNHPRCKNYGDCTKIDPNKLPDFDLLTGGFPCQSFSVAGKGKGELDPRGTLFWDIIRIAEVKQPKYMLLENVRGLTFKKHRDTFNKILSELKRIGYVVHWKVLNSKDHGIPQNRERVFFVCIRKDLVQRFEFPQKEELKLFMKDILEDEVDEKYYLSEKLTKYVLSTGTKGFYSKPETDLPIARPLLATMAKMHRPGIGNYVTTNPCEGSKILSQPLRFLTRNQKNLQGKYSGCVDSSNTNGLRINNRIRKLTPKECFRLMGFLDDKINLDGISNTQRYKLAGNGWDINLVSKLIHRLIAYNLHNTQFPPVGGKKEW